MADHGVFVGTPKTEWLTSASGEDRDMRLLENFSFTDPRGKVWPAPAGSVINGASIPRQLWALVGSPYTDDYRRASIVHDVACDSVDVDRKDADVMFFHACRAGGCGPLQARVLYAGVRLGAWASDSLPTEVLARDRKLFRARLDAPMGDEVFLQRKLSDIAETMKELPDEPTIEQLDAAIEQHIKVR